MNEKERKRVKILVQEIRGKCPVFSVGDEIWFEGAELLMDESDAFCIWSSASFLPYLIACRYDIPSSEIGTGTDDTEYFVQCLDPGPPYTCGGTAIFMIQRPD